MIDTTKYTQLLILKRHWPLAAAVALTVVAVAIPVALGAPNVYRASAKLAVERTGLGASQAGDLETRLQVIRQDALSRSHIIDLIDQLNLYPELRETSTIDVVIDRVQKDISVQPQTISVGNGSQITMSFTVGYVGGDPDMVAAVANKLASFWMKQNETIRSTQLSQVVQDYKLRLDQAQQGVSDANNALQSYMRSHASQLPSAVIRDTNQLGTVRTQLLDWNSQVVTLGVQRMNLQAQIATESQKAESVGATPDEIARTKLEGEIAHYRNDLNEADDGPDLRQRLPQLQMLNDRIAAAARERTPDAVVQSPLDVARANLADVETRLGKANDEIARLKEEERTLDGRIAAAPITDPTYDSLKNNVAVAQEIQASVKKQYDMALLNETSEKAPDSEEFQLLEGARVPGGPAGPNRLNLIVAGVFAAIVLGVGAAVLRDQLDTSFHTLDELRTFTAVPVIGSIPNIVTAQQKARRVATLVAAACGLCLLLAGVSVATYRFAQRHEGITRIVSK